MIDSFRYRFPDPANLNVNDYQLLWESSKS